jgi:hypothetical protein
MMPSDKAKKSGELLSSFLAERCELCTLADLEDYLAIRSVSRWRIIIYPGTVVFQLPTSKLGVMREVAAARTLGITWIVEPLKWWQRGRRALNHLDASDVIG